MSDDRPASLSTLHELPWSQIRGAYIRVHREVIDVQSSTPPGEQPDRISDEREGRIVGREVGEGLYYDSDRGESIATRIGPAVYLDTPEGTILEVMTDKGENELLEYTPKSEAQADAQE